MLWAAPLLARQVGEDFLLLFCTAGRVLHLWVPRPPLSVLPQEDVVG